MAKLRIQAQDPKELLKSEIPQLEAINQAIDNLIPLVQDLENKEAAIAHMFPSKPNPKDYPSTEAYWAAQDDWSETPEGNLYYELAAIPWSISLLPQLTAAKEDVSRMIQKLNSIL